MKPRLDRALHIDCSLEGSGSGLWAGYFWARRFATRQPRRVRYAL